MDRKLWLNLLKTRLVEKELQLFEIKVLYEWMYENYTKGNFDFKFALYIYECVHLLKDIYSEITLGIYDEHYDAQFEEYTDRRRSLVFAHVDRDEQGNMLYNENKEPVISENIVEYNNDIKKLDDEFRDLITRLETKGESNMKFLEGTQKISLCDIRLVGEITDKIPPIIAGILFKE